MLTGGEVPKCSLPEPVADKSDNTPAALAIWNAAAPIGGTLAETYLRSRGLHLTLPDMPGANELTVHIMAAVAQAERKAISKRTTEALQAAKARGQVLGNPNGAAALRRAQRGNLAAIDAVKAGAEQRAGELRPIVEDLHARGITSLAQIATALNGAGIVTARGGKWHASSVRNLLARLG